MTKAFLQLRYAWVWLRLDIALAFIPRDLREMTLELWREHSEWQKRQNELKALRKMRP